MPLSTIYLKQTYCLQKKTHYHAVILFLFLSCARTETVTQMRGPRDALLLYLIGPPCEYLASGGTELDLRGSAVLLERA